MTFKLALLNCSTTLSGLIMSKIKAVVFDLDGTLLNTVEFVVRSFEHSLKRHNQALDRDQIFSLVGPPLKNIYEGLVPEEHVERAVEAHRKIQSTAEFQELLKEYYGLRELLDELKGLGLRLMIFTNRWRGGVEMIFKRLDIRDYFEIIMTPDEIKNGKPDPEGLEMISKLTGLTKESLIMVGDMEVDILAGKNAGVAATVGITHGFRDKSSLEKAGADYIIDSLEELVPVIEMINKS